MTLLDRLRAATEGSVELDKEVLWEIFPEKRKAMFDGVRHVSTMTGANGDPWFSPLADRHDVPLYTTSMDTAMTLVPNDWRWIILRLTRGFQAAVQVPDRSIVLVWHEAATVPLAIVIAALTARGIK